MKGLRLALGLGAALASGGASAIEGSQPVQGIPHIDHVYVIMMENHGYGQIIGNPNAPFANSWAAAANLATDYFAIGHPSLTNYLEVVGGSNFGVRSDNSPDFHSTSCMPNLATGQPNLDNPSPSNPLICPIAGVGADAVTPIVDCTNEYSRPSCGNDIDGKKFYPRHGNIDGKTIADQLVAAGATWKTYQESLPVTGADNVTVSDGEYSNLTNFTTITPALTPPLSSSDIVALYAVKHNPFAYFQSVQSGASPKLSFQQVVGFDQINGLWGDLAAGKSPSYSFIVPNQCNDQHGRGNGTAFCAYDPNDNGTQAGLNPALIYAGDLALQKIVTAIKASPTWTTSNNAIIALWDENDYSNIPNINKVPVIVDTSYGVHGVQSANYYNHFALLKSIEGGLGLPCLNHACDSGITVMSDLFAQ